MLLSRTYSSFVAIAATICCLVLPASASAEWNLESAVRRALDVAPETQTARAEVAAREGTYREADAWPNPSISVRADNKLGMEDNTGGRDVTQLELRQPIPLRRLGRDRDVASANLDAARNRERFELLKLERETAHAFHQLQLAQAKRRLADQRVALVESSTTARDRLVRYLAPAERERLAILREQAHQGLIAAQTEEERSAIAFRALLALPAGASVETAAPSTTSSVPTSSELEQQLSTHPLLVAGRHETDAAQAGIAAAESRRFADPELSLFRERDSINGARRDVTGIGISVQIPLWNANAGPVDRARAEAEVARTRVLITERETRAKFAQTYAQLLRLREQTGRYEKQLLSPSKRVLDLTQRSFAAGEVNVLALVDALNTYVESHTRYNELLAESAEAWAELQLATGVSTLASTGGR